MHGFGGGFLSLPWTGYVETLSCAVFLGVKCNGRRNQAAFSVGRWIPSRLPSISSSS